MPATVATIPKIQCRALKKSFGSRNVLRGVNLAVEAGQSLVIIGGSGTGKSVLLKSILGLISPDSGEVLIDGKDVTHLNTRDRDALMRRFGMLFQGGALFDSITVAENISFGIKGLNKAQRNELAVEKLKMVGLGADVALQRPSELSGGMQKRVALARAIARDPEIIIFDEPTTGLDPIMADVINNLIISCAKEKGITTLSITHDMASARKIADQIAMIYEGKIIWQGNAADINRSGNEYVDQFIHGRAEGPIQVGR